MYHGPNATTTSRGFLFKNIFLRDGWIFRSDSSLASNPKPQLAFGPGHHNHRLDSAVSFSLLKHLQCVKLSVLPYIGHKLRIFGKILNPL